MKLTKKIANVIDSKRDDNSLLWKSIISARDQIHFVLNSNRLHYSGMILEDHNAIYFPIPKVANTTLKKAFASIETKPKNDLSSPHKLFYPYAYKKHYKCTFVRNPFDRIVSCYCDKLLNKNNFNKPAYKDGIPVGFFMISDSFYFNMPFKEFVHTIFNIPDERADIHFRSQYRFIYDNYHNRLVDFMGKYENLIDDYNSILQCIGCSNVPVLDSKNVSKRTSIDQYYDDEAREMVALRYKKEFLFLGYKSEIPE